MQKLGLAAGKGNVSGVQGIQNVLKLLGDMAETGSLVTSLDDLVASKTANEVRGSLSSSHHDMVAGIECF